MVKRAEAGGGPGSWGVRLEEVWRSEVMEGLESEEENLKVNAVLNREPEQLFEDRSDVFGGWGSDDNMGKRVLGQLVRLLMCFTKESVPSRMAPRLGHLRVFPCLSIVSVYIPLHAPLHVTVPLLGRLQPHVPAAVLQLHGGGLQAAEQQPMGEVAEVWPSQVTRLLQQKVGHRVLGDVRRGALHHPDDHLVIIIFSEKASPQLIDGRMKQVN